MTKKLAKVVGGTLSGNGSDAEVYADEPHSTPSIRKFAPREAQGYDPKTNGARGHDGSETFAPSTTTNSIPFLSRRGVRREGTELDPALREFLDAVVIPALVKEYLSDDARNNRLALAPENVKHSVAEDSTDIEGVP